MNPLGEPRPGLIALERRPEGRYGPCGAGGSRPEARGGDVADRRMFRRTAAEATRSRISSAVLVQANGPGSRFHCSIQVGVTMCMWSRGCAAGPRWMVGCLWVPEPAAEAGRSKPLAPTRSSIRRTWRTSSIAAAVEAVAIFRPELGSGQGDQVNDARLHGHPETHSTRSLGHRQRRPWARSADRLTPDPVPEFSPRRQVVPSWWRCPVASSWQATGYALEPTGAM